MSPMRGDRYGQFVRDMLLPTWETLRRRPTYRYYDELHASQWLPTDALRAIQLERLQRLLAHAYENVPLYREQMRAAQVTPRDVRTLEDLARIPILTRDLARERSKDRESVRDPLPTIRKETSGTTGQPLLFGFEPDSETRRQAMKMRGYEWAGYRPGDRVLHFWGASPGRQARLAKRMKVGADRWLKRETFVACAVMDDKVMRDTVELIARDQPSVVMCYTQAGAELARFIRRNGLRQWGDIAVICGAERLYPHDRGDLVAAFGPRVFDTYGCREVMLIATECEEHDGLHVSMENLVVELVVTEPDGRQRPARPGETGEIVLTDLHNLGMPFIRYANGDTAVAGDDTPCRCGRGLTRIQSVEGRSSETLRDGHGAAISGVAMSYLFAGLAGDVRQFQMVQRKDSSITLRIVPNATLDPIKIDGIRANMERQFRGVPVSVETVADLPRSKAGKHRLVIAEK